MKSAWTRANELMHQRYGRQSGPWGETLLERAIAIVARMRSADSAEEVLENLREDDALDLETLSQLTVDALTRRLPHGAVSATARRLRDFARLVVERFDGSLERLFALRPDALRSVLRTINGLGPEAVDTLLLAAGEFAILPISAAVHRIAKRHGWIDHTADSATLSAELAGAIPDATDDCWQLHVLLERVGKDYCRAQPLCGECPLVTLLPDGGPLESE